MISIDTNSLGERPFQRDPFPLESGRFNPFDNSIYTQNNHVCMYVCM